MMAALTLNQLLNIINGQSTISQLQNLDTSNMNAVQKANAFSQPLVTGIGAGAAGLSTILNNSFDLAQNADVSQYQNQIADRATIGENASSLPSILNSYSQINNSSPEFTEDDVRGKSTWEKIGGIGSSTLAGAAAGAQIGGPVGAAIGAGLGLVGSGAATLIGNENATLDYNTMQLDNKVAAQRAYRNSNGNAENYQQNRFNAQLGTVRANGGGIARKLESLQSFTDRVMGYPKNTASASDKGFTYKRVNGGLSVSFKKHK